MDGRCDRHHHHHHGAPLFLLSRHDLARRIYVTTTPHRFKSAPRKVTRRSRDGYATRQNRGEPDWLRVGSALALAHSKRLGV